MARNRTTKAGIKVRYFTVVYSKTAKDETFAAMHDLICKRVRSGFFGCGTHGDEGEQTFIAFAIAEEVADAYGAINAAPTIQAEAAGWCTTTLS